MMQSLRYCLAQLVDKIDAGNSTISDENAGKLVELIKQYTDNDRRVSKYEACQILGVSRATFDNMVREGKIPRGEHQIGFKELSWKKSDILKFK